MKRVLAVVAVGVLAAGLFWFEPWRLFTSSTVDEAAPTEGASLVVDAPDVPDTGPPEPEDQIVSVGEFVDGEHGTDGTAYVLELADGRRFVRLEGLATSDGPDLHVWLSDQPSGGDWGSYDDGRYVKLGMLKATHGNQNYELPADARIRGLRSVVIWCDRFDVAFGTAPMTG